MARHRQQGAVRVYGAFIRLYMAGWRCHVQGASPKASRRLSTVTNTRPLFKGGHLVNRNEDKPMSEYPPPNVEPASHPEMVIAYAFVAFGGAIVGFIAGLMTAWLF